MPSKTGNTWFHVQTVSWRCQFHKDGERMSRSGLWNILRLYRSNWDFSPAQQGLWLQSVPGAASFHQAPAGLTSNQSLVVLALWAGPSPAGKENQILHPVRRCWFHLQQDLDLLTAPKLPGTGLLTVVLLCDGPASSADLNCVENLWCIVMRKRNRLHASNSCKMSPDWVQKWTYLAIWQKCYFYKSLFWFRLSLR